MTTIKPNSIPFESLNVRTATGPDQQLWYCAKDVHSELGISWSGAALNKTPAEYRTLLNMATPKGDRATVFISRKAVGRLINRSLKPIAMSIAIEVDALVF